MGSVIYKNKICENDEKNVVPADFVFIICGNVILGYIYGEDYD